MNKKYIIPIVLVVIIVVAWLLVGGSSSKDPNIFVKPKTGPFQVNITTNGELKAKNSTEIMAPGEDMRKVDVHRTTIQKLVPEGTVVKKGDFVAQLDVSGILTETNNDKLDLQQRQTDLRQAKLDSAQALSKARNNIINLGFSVKQAKIAVTQSKYESPATQQKVKFSLQKAERQLANAKRSYKMTEIGQKTKVQHLQRRVQQEQNEVNNDKKIVPEFTILAPQNGMVIYAKRGFNNSKVTEGDQVSAGRRSVVAQLPDFSVMQSATYVNEVDIQEVKVGQKVNISLDAYPDKHLTGVVTDIANIGEQRPGSSAKVFRVIIQIDQSEPKLLRPSMTTRNIIHVDYVDSALYIPLTTIHVYHDSLNVVYKHHGGGPVMQQVLLGLMNDNDAIVKAGLTPDAQLYLSMPSDTSDAKKVFLPDSIIQKYKAREEKQATQQINSEHSRKRKMLHGRGHIPQKGKKGQGLDHSSQKAKRNSH